MTVAGGLTFVTVATAYYHSCGLTAAGQAYCWGTNYHGALGTNDSSPTGSTVPVAVVSPP